jgi:hypothetical protein
MYETEDGYIFVTFQDGKVIFYKDSYKRHCSYRDSIKGEKGREAIQNALINPDFIISYTRTDLPKTICKKYYSITGKTKTVRGLELEYWEIILQKKPNQKLKIVTAYIASAPEYAMIDDRVEKVIYKKTNYGTK